jgi:AcrR family transcriptional regulator
MARLFSRAFRRRVKRRIKAGLQDDKTFRLYRAACRLLAEHDHEQISVAQFAQAAEMSVGAVYQRHANKEALLGAVVAERLSRERQRLEHELARHAWQHQPIAAVTRAIVDAMMRGLHGPGAGVVRTALKRGYLDRGRLGPLLDYRAAVADQAVALLAPRLTHIKKPQHAIRAAMQMAEATALDALLHEKGPLRPGSSQMAATLSAMLCGMLDPSGAPLGAPVGDETGVLDMPIEEVVAMPVPDSPPARTRQRSTNQPEAVPLIRPTSAAPPPADPEAEPVKPGRHRPRL